MPDPLDGEDVGATAVEYALMISLIALVVFSAVALLGLNVSALFEDPTLSTAISQ